MHKYKKTVTIPEEPSLFFLMTMSQKGQSLMGHSAEKSAVER